MLLIYLQLNGVVCEHWHSVYNPMPAKTRRGVPNHKSSENGDASGAAKLA